LQFFAAIQIVLALSSLVRVNKVEAQAYNVCCLGSDSGVMSVVFIHQLLQCRQVVLGLGHVKKTVPCVRPVNLVTSLGSRAFMAGKCLAQALLLLAHCSAQAYEVDLLVDFKSKGVAGSIFHKLLAKG